MVTVVSRPEKLSAQKLQEFVNGTFHFERGLEIVSGLITKIDVFVQSCQMSIEDQPIIVEAQKLVIHLENVTHVFEHPRSGHTQSDEERSQELAFSTFLTTVRSQKGTLELIFPQNGKILLKSPLSFQPLFAEPYRLYG